MRVDINVAEFYFQTSIGVVAEKLEKIAYCATREKKFNFVNGKFENKTMATIKGVE